MRNGFGRIQGDTRWRMIPEDETGRARLPLLTWQLPELMMLSVTDGATASSTLPPASSVAGTGVAVPVVPETC